MIIPVKTSQGQYDIVLMRGALKKVSELINLSRRVLIVTDDGVPTQYAKCVADAAEQPFVVTINQGESSKHLDTWQQLLSHMVQNDFTRGDCVVAVGGGVVGDLAGFAAAAYMRGIDFYNIPTTVLSQVDSSIGGKTAVDFMGYKNLVGAFWQPKKVIIDPDTLLTLQKRQLSNGLAESVKMALTSDTALFELFEKTSCFEGQVLCDIIERSILIKRSVVEQDEKENGLRRVLNFGHTLGHALESINEMKNFYHGECVALGMLPMCEESVRRRLISVLEKLNLPYKLDIQPQEVVLAARHDKKAVGDTINVITVSSVGSFEQKNISFEQYEKMITQVM